MSDPQFKRLPRQVGGFARIGWFQVCPFPSDIRLKSPVPYGLGILVLQIQVDILIIDRRFLGECVPSYIG